MTKFLFLYELGYQVDRNSAPEEFAYIWQSERVGIITIKTEKMRIHFSCDVFVAVSCRGILYPNIYEGVIDASVNTCCTLKLVFFWRSICSFRVDSILKWRVYIKLKVSWLCAFLRCMSQTSRDWVNSGRVQTHEKNSGDAVRRLGTIIHSIFCAKSGASIRLTIWKWSGESRYPRAFPPVLENFRRAFSVCPTDRPWVSEDVQMEAFNDSMSNVRTFVEWLFGGIVEYFKFMDLKLKIGLSSSGKLYVVCTLLRNVLTCLYGNSTSSFFELDPPTLEEYFSQTNFSHLSTNCWQKI